MAAINNGKTAKVGNSGTCVVVGIASGMEVVDDVREGIGGFSFTKNKLLFPNFALLFVWISHQPPYSDLSGTCAGRFYMKEAASCWWEANTLGREFSWCCGGCATLVLAAIIVAAAFTSVPAFVPVVRAAEIPGTIVGMSGAVEISTDGSNWRPLVSSDTIISGDSVMTGSGGLLLVQFSSGGQILGKILLGGNTNVTYIDPHHHHRLKILLGILWANVQSATGGTDDFEADIGDTAVAGIRGTELTAAAYENGTANVMVIEGLVEVQDAASNSTVLLQTNQAITVPNTSGGLSQQEMSSAVETVNPTANGAWWEQTSFGPIATLTPSSTTFPTSTLVMYLVALAVVAVTVTGAMVLYTRRRKAKH